jgi:hypothetical protein
MKNVRPPRFLENLYRDMRDRRLLIPALALLVALVAVPVLLKSSTPTSPAPVASAAATDDGDQTAAEPAVVTAQAGITDYRKRLGWLQSKDPFRSRVPVESPGAGQGAGSSTNAGSTTGTSFGTSTPSASSSSSVSSTSGSASSTTTSTSPSSGGGGSGSGGSQNGTKPGWYSFRVSVAIGRAGDLTDRKNVQRLQFLPGDNRPIVAFIGVNENGKRAIFMVSDRVSSVRGDGKCIPRRGDCQFLELKPGDKASFRYEPEGNRTYNLKLREIKLVPVGKIHASVSGKSGTQPQLGPDG